MIRKKVTWVASDGTEFVDEGKALMYEETLHPRRKTTHSRDGVYRALREWYFELQGE
jgi:hypothetical protein